MVLKPNSDRQWQRIVDAGLCPGITDEATYQQRANAQLNVAFATVMAEPPLVPHADYVAAVHSIIFKDIHPWAGTFRRLGQTVRFDQGVLGTDSHRIAADLERIAQETEEALARAPNPQEKAVAIACYHARYRRVHPFLDGNTRTSAVLLQGQIKTVYGIEQPSTQRPDDYKQKLALAYRGEIAPLTNHVLTVAGFPHIEPRHVKLPAPRFDQDLETEIVKHREAILARQRGPTV